MFDEFAIESLGIIIAAAALFVLAARMVRVPAIIAFLISGLLLGPLTNLVSISSPIELISKSGIALLLFLVGLELSFEKFRDLGKTALLAGVGQVAATATLAWLLGVALGFSPLESVFVSMALTLSSTVVVVKLLDDKQELDALYGRIAIAILLFQDLVVIMGLTFLAGLGQEVAFDMRSLAWTLCIAVGKMSLLLVGVMVVLRYLLARPFAWAARSQEMLFVWSLCWCFIVVSVAHALHLSEESGAFLAGISLAQLPYSHDVQHRTHPLMNFFIAVFFVTLGIQMQPAGVMGDLGRVATLIIVVLLVKPLIIFGVLYLLRVGARASFLTAVTLSQISEFSFLLLALGVSKGLIQSEVLAAVGMVGLVTIAVSAFAITHNHRLLLRFRRLPMFREETRTGTRERQRFKPKRSGHVIVVGLNTLGKDIANRLHDLGERVLALDTDPRKLAAVRCATMHGNAEYLSVLQAADLAQAKLLVSALHIESANELLAYRCNSLGVPCSVNVTDLSVTEYLLELNVTYLMIPKVDGIKAQKRVLKELGILEG